MGCCGGPGHLRISKKGTRHFYHASDTGCTSAGESKEHLEIKEGIYRICKSEGWETFVEYPAPGRTWISDVCAVRDGRNIVFEVQISSISLDELEDRDRNYRNEGIESYWLLDNFPGRSRGFESWSDAQASQDERPGEQIPYIDPSLFATGPENHIFIAQGIRSIGLRAQQQTVYTTRNPEIPLGLWVREVLKGTYKRYLEETAAGYRRKRRLKNQAAPELIRFGELYGKIVRNETYRKKAESCYRILKTDPAVRNGNKVKRMVDELGAELDWVEQEYRACISETSGLFTWKKTPGHATPRPFFRLESAAQIRKLQERVQMFSQWETAFYHAVNRLEQDFLVRD